MLCLDGTWNSVFELQEREDKTTVLKPANPLKLARAVIPVASETDIRQITYYDSGVGALGLYPGISNSLLHFADSKLGGAWGAGFEANVEQAATFISSNYSAGDEIFMFGFSRGATQARALTNFLSWLGGLPGKDDAYYIPIFFRHYLSHQGKGSARDIVNSRREVIAERVKPLEIKFLGVWDTVSALGPRFGATRKTAAVEKEFHTRSNPAACVKTAYHAISIDEQRFDFRPEIWQTSLEGQHMQQCWFAGSHGNVGGSYGNDGLANCALHWIVDAAKDEGLIVDESFLGKYRAFPQDELGDPYTLGYKIIESLRFSRGRGKRGMLNQPDTANLSVHPTAIMRLCSDPSKFDRMKEPYRPSELIDFVRAQPGNESDILRGFGLEPDSYTIPNEVLSA